MKKKEFSNQPKNMEFKPRVHGNGFIQLDLTPTRRLHIWGHPSIPTQITSTQIHDHMFGFTSRVLVGAMKNIVYHAVMSKTGEYAVHQAQVRDREDTVLVPNGERANLIIRYQHVCEIGHSYVIEKGDIHESKPVGFTATIIDKSGPTLSQGGPSPRVFVKVGDEPDNDFNRYSVPEDQLWSIISDVLMKGRI